MSWGRVSPEAVKRIADEHDARHPKDRFDLPLPAWVCLCGARNRLRDLTCRNCGAHKP